MGKIQRVKMFKSAFRYEKTVNHCAMYYANN